MQTQLFSHISFGKHRLTCNKSFQMFPHNAAQEPSAQVAMAAPHKTDEALVVSNSRATRQWWKMGSWHQQSWQLPEDSWENQKGEGEMFRNSHQAPQGNSCRICAHVAFYDALTTSCWLVKWSIPRCPHLLTRDQFDEEIMTKNYCSKNMKQSHNNNHLQWTQGLYPFARSQEWMSIFWLWRVPSHNAWCLSHHRAPDSHSNAWKLKQPKLSSLPGTQSR